MVALAATLLAGSRVRGQSPFLPSPETSRESGLSNDLMAAFRSQPAPVEPQPVGSAARVRMFGMMPGFLADPVGVIDSNLPTQAATTPSSPFDGGLGYATVTDDSGPNWIQLTLGDDIPFFDMRRPGDPGGVGYYKLYSQLQLVDVGTTSVCLNLQAVTPAGLQSGGVQDGPTVLTPGLGLFQELGAGTALHGFVGQHIWTGARPADPSGRALQYGMGFQCPLLAPSCSDQGVFLFVRAVGRYYYDGDTRSNGRTMDWDLVPGIHWRVNDKCWMSLGASHNGMFTWAWQF
jgi:hypothetical protein